MDLISSDKKKGDHTGLANGWQALGGVDSIQDKH